jgi:hypothetical protein
MPAVIRAKSWPSRSTSPTTVTPSARKAAASPAPGNPAPRQTGGSNDPRTPREQPKGSTQGEARVGGRGRARTTGSPNVGSCGGRVAAATCTGGVGFASLSAPRSVAGPGRSRSVTTMAPPTSQLQDPQPVGSAIHRPLTAADVMTRRRGRRPAARTAIDRRGLGATRHRPVEEGGPAAALHPGKDRGPAARR